MLTTQQPQRPQRPKLPSFGPYENTSSSSSSQPSPGALFASCRTLQSILTAPSQPARSQAGHTPNLRLTPQSTPYLSTCGLQSPAPLVTPPPNATKRKRDDADEDDTMDLDEAPGPLDMREIFQTPKRQRRIPVDLPLGLDASDFDALCTPEVPRELDQMECDQPVLMHHARDLQSHSGRHPQNLGWPNDRPPDDARQLFEPTINQFPPLQA